MQDKKIAAALRQPIFRPAIKDDGTLTIAATSASGMDSQWKGLQLNRSPGSTATRLTAITGSIKYPRARKSNNTGQEHTHTGQKLAKCPCCC